MSLSLFLSHCPFFWKSQNFLVCLIKKRTVSSKTAAFKIFIDMNLIKLNLNNFSYIGTIAIYSTLFNTNLVLTVAKQNKKSSMFKLSLYLPRVPKRTSNFPALWHCVIFLPTCHQNTFVDNLVYFLPR